MTMLDPNEKVDLGIPPNIQSISDLPEGKTLILSEGELAVASGVREQLAIYELAGTVSSGPKPVLLIVADEFASGVMPATFRKNLIKSTEYKLIKVVKIGRQLMSALYSEHASAHEGAGGNELIMFFEKMVSIAMKNHVSDIHIEKRRDHALIRMRKHGELMEYNSAISPQYAIDLCSVIYNVLAENKDIVFTPEGYQAAAVNRIIDGVEVKLRYQSLETYPEGFDVVLRVLPIGRDDESFVQLDRLGYSPTQVKTIIDVISKPVGALIIAGTTGSGKSTTLKNLLMFANAAKGYKAKIYTVEDPPEYRIPRVSQIPVVRRKSEDYSIKSPFADPLMAVMRGDPDILMIGEVRDHFTGDGLKKATQSGHQVMSTTHASSALAVVERLIDFGLTPAVLGSPEFLTGLIYQKLLPVLCDKCSASFLDMPSGESASSAMLALGERLREVCDLEKDVIKVRGAGCDNCGGMGVSGRTVCAEVISPDFHMLRLFKEQDATATYEYWRSLSDNRRDSINMDGKPALEHALFKMRVGMVSPLDIEEAFGPVDLSKRMLEQARQSRESLHHGMLGGHAGTASGKSSGKNSQDDGGEELGSWAELPVPIGGD